MNSDLDPVISQPACTKTHDCSLHLFFCTQRAEKYSDIHRSSAFLCVAASVFSGLIITLALTLFTRQAGDVSVFLIYYLMFSFIIGAPTFIVGLPALHFLPHLKHASPRGAGLIGTAVAGAISIALLLMSSFSKAFTTWQEATTFIACLALWGGIASCVYQRTRQ
ncbi:hypothetical protein VDS18_05895 [Xanthomonas campestris pv. campestris]|nr:hypothetical protein [Xanthomonas campestris pv. campestris]